MPGSRSPWSAESSPEDVRHSIDDYVRVFGRDPRVVWQSFLDAANSPKVVDDATRRIPPARRGSTIDDANVEVLVTVARVSAGWSAVHALFPGDKRAWTKHRLERSRHDQEEQLTQQGAQLFAEVIRCLRAHYYLEKEWHYTICALFVMQAWVVRAGALPAVFYLYFGGSMSSGKSSVLNLVSSLSDGIMLENVSPSALARVIGDGRTVLLDEFDVQRGEELDDVMASLLRSGYRRNGPPYVRWNAKDKQAETLSIFGPKCGTFRSALDPALQSRGFVIPTAKPIGEEHFGLILAGWWPKTGELVPRLKKWGEWSAAVWKSEKLEQAARSSVFQARLRTIVGQLGANRESELLTLALLVAEMVPVDVVDSLASARELRAVEISEDQAEAIDELRTAVLDVVSKTISFTSEGREVYRVVQKSVRDHLNYARKARGDRPISTGRLALLRRELGVSDSWLVEKGHRVVWNMPSDFMDLLRKQALVESTDDGATRSDPHPPGYSPSPPHLPPYSPRGVRGEYARLDDSLTAGGSRGVRGEYPEGGVPSNEKSSTPAGPRSPEVSDGLTEESDLSATKGDRAREAWKRDHPEGP